MRPVSAKNWVLSALLEIVFYSLHGIGVGGLLCRQFAHLSGHISYPHLESSSGNRVRGIVADGCQPEIDGTLVIAII